jgi:NAD(P)-dependent dehydrogenase (short-subunit alcohol dehydrogenase family)
VSESGGGKLAGRRALVTGSSRGLGLAIARAFVEEGASVMLCARSGGPLEAARRELSALAASVAAGAPAGDERLVAAMTADVSSPDEVRRLVEGTTRTLGGIDILVCNAGIYGPMGAFDEVDWSEWVAAVAINLNGVALVCREVLPQMKERRSGKIVVLSGGGATKPMPNVSAYAASKAAVVRLAETIAEEVREFGIDVNSIAPGALNTRLLDEVLAAGPEKVGEAFYAQSLRQKADGGSSLERGASLCVFLASAQGDGITGKLISAVWDPWAGFGEHRDELKGTDIYTLRRIVPEDRGRKWS